MRRIKLIFTDFHGLCFVCGLRVALRWLLAVFTHLFACRRDGNLQPADAVLGDGPYRARHGNSSALLTCHKVLTGIRETWVRDGYLGRGFLTLKPDSTVVDLGSNMGIFSLLALGHGPGVRLFAVEADPAECERLRINLDLNGWTDRVTLINAFIGGRGTCQQEMAATDRFSAVGSLTADELLQRAGPKINFLKCDIEGSEFGLFTPQSPLLKAAEQIAMEVHPLAGNADELIQTLKSAGFEIRVHTEPSTLTVLARRR